MKITKSLLLPLLGLAGYSNSVSACSSALNSVVYNTVKPVIESQKVCDGLKRSQKILFEEVTVGIDKTKKVQIMKFEYCAGLATSFLMAQISVTCETSSKAVFQASVSEDISLNAVIDNLSCKITSFDASPHGEIGKLIANNIGFKSDVKKSLQDNLNTLCGN
jgi:hypothetical protein